MPRRLLLLSLLAVLGAPAVAPPASAKTGWLCRPGQAENPCEPSLSTTVFDRFGGTGTVTRPKRRARRVDCFYVYPTVSDQAGPNATPTAEPSVRSIALYQAARFSQVCRVYAPLYRQLTVPALTGDGVTRAVVRTAYRDVAAAWKVYLRKYNHGRGVVLLGHSQGTWHLQKLIRERVDGKPVSRRLVSALLLGGNVTVRRGRTAGGVFEHVRACRSRAQLRCVVAYSTYNAAPPEAAVFGRDAGRLSRALGLPAGSRYEVLCTNPGDLGRNRRVDYRTIAPAAPFAPGTLIAAGISILGFPIPPVSTSFIEGRGLFAGRCSSAGGANVLRVQSENGTPVLEPSPDANWGLHLIDVSVAQGDLVALVRAQAARYARR